MTNASNVGGGGTLFQWQALEKEEFDSAISQPGTEGLNRDGTLKHSYPDDKWVLVPLGHRNWKWNQARGNYSTYEQELLAGMLVLSSQARLLGSNPVVWLCDQERVRTFQKGPPPEKAKLRRWWNYLSQLRLTVHPPMILCATKKTKKRKFSKSFMKKFYFFLNNNFDLKCEKTPSVSLLLTKIT